jgi:hypothetical protein
MQNPASQNQAVPALLFAVTIFLSAFLLFEVQPMVGKIILPWFGGSAAVWTTCILFFQLLLLGGYIYADLTSRLLPPRAQGMLHAALLLLALFTLPLNPSSEFAQVGDGNPEWRIALVLGLSVGLPYFLLSTTGPLLQAWYARGGKQALPYRMYALSNLGSMLALLSYPFLVEPNFMLGMQTRGWSWGFGAFAVLCAALSLRNVQFRAQIATTEVEPPAVPPTKATAALWAALAACASVLLLAVTSHLTQNIAPIPFLWVLPLGLYLLSFILCFEGTRWYSRGPYVLALAICIGLVCLAVLEGPSHPEIWRLISLYSITMFFACMVCHGELAALKPHPRYLTRFYLMLSLGGALGGTFVALIAPHVFRDTLELPIGIVAVIAVFLVVLYRDPHSPMYRGKGWPRWALAFALLLAVAGMLGMGYVESARDAKVMLRNFYGWLKVEDSGSGTSAERTLTHGTITHGMQYLAPERARWPTTYYGRNSGAGLAVSELGTTGYVKVGVVGLGTGTFAAYGRKGDTFRFYDINPQVLVLATAEFTYLRDCEAKVDVVLGDARLSMAGEPSQQFDLLVLDAFSSDAIPVHLLTREAFALYFGHLSPRGVLAVHISNRYLDLKPVVKQAAQFFGREARLVDSEGIDYIGVYSSDWILVAQDPKIFESESLKLSAEKFETRPIRMWTDDFSDLYQILK